MKKINVVLVVMLVLTVLCGVARAEMYPLTGVIVSLDYDADVVEVEDFNGNRWAFEGCEDWELYDVCSMIMEDNNTTSIYDDEIVQTHYSGWLAGWTEKMGF